jgi:hypothetical protein
MRVLAGKAGVVGVGLTRGKGGYAVQVNVNDPLSVLSRKAWTACQWSKLWSALYASVNPNRAASLRTSCFPTYPDGLYFSKPPDTESPLLKVGSMAGRTPAAVCAAHCVYVLNVRAAPRRVLNVTAVYDFDCVAGSSKALESGALPRSAFTTLMSRNTGSHSARSRWHC